uniref:BZIP domain-containing protein n=1 Tax=Oryza punctata TaxID=4537 RepID=A0A0E0JWG5_ORYPU
MDCAGDDDAVAADIICSLRGADLAGWTPPWWCSSSGSKRAQREELIWPPVTRGKRSRRRSPSAVVATAGKKRKWARASPVSPLDYSGGSGSGSGSVASTSGGEDGAFCSPPGHRPAPATTKVGAMDRQQQLPFLAPSPLLPAGQRPRKKMRLPEVQQLVRSLAVENDSLREEMRALQRACTALSKENGKLEIRLEISSSRNKPIITEDLKGKQQIDQQSATQSIGGGFSLPDLNIPVQDVADGSVH